MVQAGANVGFWSEAGFFIMISTRMPNNIWGAHLFHGSTIVGSSFSHHYGLSWSRPLLMLLQSHSMVFCLKSLLLSTVARQQFCFLGSLAVFLDNLFPPSSRQFFYKHIVTDCYCQGRAFLSNDGGARGAHQMPQSIIFFLGGTSTAKFSKVASQVRSCKSSI